MMKAKSKKEKFEEENAVADGAEEEIEDAEAESLAGGDESPADAGGGEDAEAFGSDGSGTETVGSEGAEAGGSEGSGTETGGSDGSGAEAEGGEGGESADVKYLRLAADFQNYKKRVEKERYERYSDGKKDFAADMLPILDNFDRALAQYAADGSQKDAAPSDSEHGRAVIEGMEMILRQFLDALAKNGVKEIAALGEPFDPNVHHAVLMEPSGEYDSQTVSEVLQKGYSIGDKVIRPAMVKVAE